MILDRHLDTLRDLIQRDPGGRGLATDPADNLLTAHPADFANACRSIAETPSPHLTVVTGFFIPSAGCGETDGPLGALFLARALVPLGVRVTLASDHAGLDALKMGIDLCHLSTQVDILSLPAIGHPTHLVALERVGPTHTPTSIRRHPDTTPEDIAIFAAEIPEADHDRCHTMRGKDITAETANAWHHFEAPADARPITIGIGDGGNEIGMGKIRWSTIRRNVPNGGRVACRIATDFLIVAGVSNWGAYALAAGVALTLNQRLSPELLDADAERQLLTKIIDTVPLVDGVTGERTATVDGLPWDEYADVLTRMQ